MKNEFGMEDKTFKQKLEEYKLSQQEIYYKSQDAFEQKLTVISTSTLGASIFFLEKLVPNIASAEAKWAIVISWVMLGTTLLVNLISHRISATNCYQSISEINDGKYDADKATERHKQIDRYNRATIWALGLGIFFLVLFSVVNLICMSNQTQPTPSSPSPGEKGLNSTPAPKPETGLNPLPAPQAPPTQNPAPKKD